MELVTSYF